MQTERTMTRGQLATAANVNAETIRFYEQKGLIPKPERTASGYRKYSDEFVVRIRFIKRAQTLGFTLKEILELLSLRLEPDSDRADIRRHVDGKIAEIDLKIVGLHRMKASLDALSACCSGRGPSKGCPILESLEGA